MTDRELMQQALDALEYAMPSGYGPQELYEDTIEALRARLAQPEPNDYERGFVDGMQQQMKSSVDKAVNAMSQREWVGLTDEEMFAALVQVDPLTKRLAPGFEYFARAIEAKLKEKNNK